MNAHHPYGAMSFHMRYPLKRFTSLCRLVGLGFQTLGSICHTRSLKMTRLQAMYTKSQLPISLWLTGGFPLDPYIEGLIKAFLIVDLKPREIKMPPSSYLQGQEISWNGLS